MRNWVIGISKNNTIPVRFALWLTLMSSKAHINFESFYAGVKVKQVISFRRFEVFITWLQTNTEVSCNISWETRSSRLLFEMRKHYSQEIALRLPHHPAYSSVSKVVYCFLSFLLSSFIIFFYKLRKKITSIFFLFETKL